MMKCIAVFAFVFISIVLVSASNNTDIRANKRCSLSNLASGYCQDENVDCPKGWGRTYEGCGSTEWCCYPRDESTTEQKPVVQTGVSCRFPYQQGHCIDKTKYKCPSTTHYTYYTGCGTDGSKDVCCYPIWPTPTDASSVKKTTSSGSSSVGQCGLPTVRPNPNGRIVGGDITTIEAHPWQIEIRKMGYIHCGGSLISDKWVLTAAHCLYGHSGLDIVVGTTFHRNYDDKSQVIAISDQVIHPRYKRGGPDLALIKLSRSVDLTATKTRAICVPESTDTFDSQTCIVSGWGKIWENGPNPDKLKQVAVPVVSRNTCDYYMQGIASWELCAGSLDGGKDACYGDSGGPLVCQGSDGAWKLAGVVSNGDGCARPLKFGLYSDVAQYRSWIEKYVILS